MTTRISQDNALRINTTRHDATRCGRVRVCRLGALRARNKGGWVIGEVIWVIGGDLVTCSYPDPVQGAGPMPISAREEGCVHACVRRDFEVEGACGRIM